MTNLLDNFNEDIVKLLISLVIGSIIGAEREYRSKSAGFRTLILVCVGSTLFTIFSIRIGLGNPDRIAANIITGIGFLGAGAIFRSDNGVGTVVILIVLLVFTRLEKFIDETHQNRNYKLMFDFDETILKQYEVLFKQYNLQSHGGKKIRRGDHIIGTWELQGALKDHNRLAEELMQDKKILEFDF
jgi:putative Mg2+ transporter-C (MgtC) family protein